MKKDLTIEDTITIPKEWVPTLIKVMGYVTDDLVDDGSFYNDGERQLIKDVTAISRGLAMRMKDAPLTVLPRTGENDD
jgi:hypothetical protein